MASMGSSLKLLSRRPGTWDNWESEVPELILEPQLSSVAKPLCCPRAETDKKPWSGGIQEMSASPMNRPEDTYLGQRPQAKEHVAHAAGWLALLLTPWSASRRWPLPPPGTLVSADGSGEKWGPKVRQDMLPSGGASRPRDFLPWTSMTSLPGTLKVGREKSYLIQSMKSILN